MALLKHFKTLMFKLWGVDIFALATLILPKETDNKQNVPIAVQWTWGFWGPIGATVCGCCLDCPMSNPALNDMDFCSIFSTKIQQDASQCWSQYFRGQSCMQLHSIIQQRGHNSGGFWSTPGSSMHNLLSPKICFCLQYKAFILKAITGCSVISLWLLPLVPQPKGGARREERGSSMRMTL